MAHADDVRPLSVTHTLAAPGAMAAAVAGDHLFFVGYSHLWAADLSDPLRPNVVGKARFQGAGRQIAVQGNVAFVTARADGLYIFDVSDPTRPHILSHYDTIELATGVDVQGDLLLIAERQYGVELVDVSDPSKPRFLSKVRTGEAQSVAASGRYAYAGDWGTLQATTLDIANPRTPRVVGHADLDGFGDGVCVQGSHLYAATGHHAPGGAFHRAEHEPGYGRGHGLEILSLADPAKPVVVSRVKFPTLFRRDGYDMWSTAVAGHYAFCADTHNGVFVVDISDPSNPGAVARYHELVGGLAVGEGAIYAACPKKGLLVLDARGMASRPAPPKRQPVAIPPAAPARPADHRLYQPGGQIRSIDFVGDAGGTPVAIVAAGMQGVHVLRLWPEVQVVARIPTTGFALHVAAQGSRMYVSEGPEGLSVWEHTGEGRFAQLGRYEDPRKQPIRHALVGARGRYAVAETPNRFVVLDVSDPAHAHQVLERGVAIIYGDQTSHGLVSGRYLCVSDHCTPMRWLDLEADDPARIDTGVDLAEQLGFFEGAVAAGDRLLVTSDGGYRLGNALGTGLEETPLYRCEKRVGGKPHVHGNGLYVVHRPRSSVAIVDISGLTKPRLLREFTTRGNPSGAVVRNRSLLIPDGYHGLLIYDDFVKTLGLDVDEAAFLPSE